MMKDTKLEDSFFDTDHFSPAKITKSETNGEPSQGINMSLNLIPCHGCNQRGWVKINSMQQDLCLICKGNGSLLQNSTGQIYSPRMIMDLEDLISQYTDNVVDDDE